MNEHYLLHFETIAFECQGSAQENALSMWFPRRFGVCVDELTRRRLCELTKSRFFFFHFMKVKIGADLVRAFEFWRRYFAVTNQGPIFILLE